MEENRYNSSANYLPATIQLPRRSADIIDLTAVSTVPATIHVDGPLQTLDGATEKTSGMDRSLALVVRMVPFTFIHFLLALGISHMATMGNAFMVVLFAGLTSITYGYLDRQERQFSRNGLERHKVDTLAELKLAEMDHTQELRRMALRAHLQMLGVDHDID